MTKRLKGNLLVVGQFVLLGFLFLYPANKNFYGDLAVELDLLNLGLLFIALVVLITGALNLGPALTAHPIPNKKATLITKGLYRYIRHPIYTGLLIAGAAFVISGGLFPQIIFYLLLVVLLNYKARFEEGLLAERFPDYVEYRKTTGRFFPRLKR
jgi:protein-S-isoprenylcysteine O-methyltransferase Ste14